MSQITEINKQILEKILKTDEFYEVFWGKVDFFPESVIAEPNDFNCGAFCNQLEYLYEFIREATNPDLDTLVDPYVDIVVYFFTGIKRNGGETDVSLLERMRSLIVRECDWVSERFGTPWDILNVFCTYIDRSFLYYIPNSVLTDILVNGDFEDPIVSEWTILPSGDRTIEDSLTGSYKIDFTSITSISQVVAVTAGTYILNSFADPIVSPVGDTDIFNLTIQRSSDSYYFNTSTLAWVVSDPLNKFTTDSDGYQLAEFFVIVDGSYNLTITFTKIVSFWLDHVEFGEKLYPAFEILYVDTGLGIDFASSWVDGVTPNDNTAFNDIDFMFGTGTSVYSSTYYQSILDILTASGVKGIFNREIKS